MLDSRTLDPLSAWADPRAYVPIESAEAALSAIGVGLEAGCSPALVSGPAGIGKTLLLAVLAERLWRAFPRTRSVTQIAKDPRQLPGALLRVLFEVEPPRRARAVEHALLNELRAPGARRTLLLLDDAHLESDAFLAKLGQLARAAKPALALVAAGTHCEARKIAETLGAGLIISLPESLADGELALLYDALLAHPGLSPKLRERLASADRAEIVAAAKGLPTLLKRELVRRNLSRPVIVSEPLPPARPRPRAVQTPVPEPAPAPAAVTPAVEQRPAPAPVRKTRARSIRLSVGPLAALRLLLTLLALAGEGLREGFVGAVELSGSVWAGAGRALRWTRGAALRPLHAASRARVASAGAAQRTAASLAARVREHSRQTRRTGVRVHARAVESRARAGVAVRNARSRIASALHATRGAMASSMRVGGVLAALWLAIGLFPAERQPVARPAPHPAALARAEHRPNPPMPPAVKRAPTPPPIDVHVNARPWARVWIDGVDLGATPLRHALAPGRHQLAAEFPGGRRIAREIDVDAQRRFVALR